MKLVSLVLLLSFAALRPAWTAEADAPPVLRADDVRSATEALKAAYDRDGTWGARQLSETCYRQLSRQPTWRRFDRCLTVDYVANTLILGPYFDFRVMDGRWIEAEKGLGVDRPAVEARSRQIGRAIPWEVISPRLAAEPRPPSR